MQFEFDWEGAGGTVVIVLLLLLMMAAWFTHVFTCFAEDAWGFLIAGAIFFPVAIAHGFYIWFV